MPDIDWLVAERFRHVGHWTKPHPKLCRIVLLGRTRGIYAFVVEGRIHYIGKSISLRHRIRQYNRALADETRRGFRKVHCGIRQVWTADRTVDVWVYDFDETRDGSLGGLEAKWIKEKRPEWNG